MEKFMAIMLVLWFVINGLGKFFSEEVKNHLTFKILRIVSWVGIGLAILLPIIFE